MWIIAGLFRQQRLVVPKGGQTRPTSNRLREAIFNICQDSVGSAHFLDLFSGSGAMGLEALSRGAQTATFVDNDKEAIHCIETNIDKLKVKKQCRLLRGDVFSMLRLLVKEGKIFDIIYVDPPYSTIVPGSEEYYSAQILRWMDNHSLLAPNGTLFIEERLSAQPNSQHLHLQKIKLDKSRSVGSSILQQYRLPLV